MRIGELARRTGVAERLLRYYEAKGLLTPARGDNGYRDYDATAIQAVLAIRQLLAAGLPTATIAEMTSCLHGELLPEQRRAELLDRLTQTRDGLDDTITRLQTARSALNDLISKKRESST